MNKEICWEVKFDLLSPLHIGSGYGHQTQVDSTLVYWPDKDGRRTVPASSLKGVLRSDWDNNCLSADEVFGTSNMESRVRFSNGEITNCTLSHRSRIRIDLDTLVVAEHALFKEEIIESGNIIFQIVFPDDLKLKNCLCIALKNLDALGSGKSIGRGRVKLMEIREFQRGGVSSEGACHVEIVRACHD